MKITFLLLRFSLVSFCFLFLLVFSFCSPFLLLSVPFSFLSPLWFPFFVCFFFFFFLCLLPFRFIVSSSLCLRFLCSSSSYLVSCSPFFSLLLLVLSFFLSVATSPFPLYLPLFLFLLQFFLLLFFSSLSPLPTFFSSSFLSYCPVLLFSPLFILLLFLLFLVLQLFLFFVFPPLSPVSSFPSVIISCLFLSLASSSSFTPPFSLPLLFFFGFSFPFGY